MRLLLDQGLPRSTVEYLYKFGFEADHVGELGMAAASDAKILDFAREEGCVVVTLDADFHALLTFARTTGPSVIRVRIEGLGAEGLARLLVNVLEICEEDVKRGAVVSVTEAGVRIRQLPLLR
jgi:predicted nuclease of predicted toxin-antitoxin system